MFSKNYKLIVKIFFVVVNWSASFQMLHGGVLEILPGFLLCIEIHLGFFYVANQSVHEKVEKPTKILFLV